MIYNALFGLFGSLIVCACNRGLQKYMEEGSRVSYCWLTTLAIKFLHFFVAKLLQFRFQPMLLLTSSIPSMLFWVAFTRSISSMSDD
ncbi:hypothetical protein Pint_08497 [Pistacia integerrima]|uniref:Uncharacterized protein n=1 Tax=Pistacia integerrima TaxID=434235 RepID=A0ACC0XVR9_9ROSI|nr:hypothetical protein Pint_08497 [Pistacia integerrima]